MTTSNYASQNQAGKLLVTKRKDLILEFSFNTKLCYYVPHTRKLMHIWGSIHISLLCVFCYCWTKRANTRTSAVWEQRGTFAEWEKTAEASWKNLTNWSIQTCCWISLPVYYKQLDLGRSPFLYRVMIISGPDSNTSDSLEIIQVASVHSWNFEN